MAHVVALNRYPIKGFTPELVDQLTILPDGRVEGDRLFAVRFGDAAVAEDQEGLDYWPKAKGVSLQDFPSLAPLRLTYCHETKRATVRVSSGAGAVDDAGEVLIDTVLDHAGRAEFAETITEFVQKSPEARRLAREGRLPLSMVGDGIHSRFQDRPRGYVSLHSSASVASLGDALGMEIDDRRFRSNVVVAGLTPNEELSWTDGVRIGDVEFKARGPIVRCLATHANPDSGVRDAKVLTTLTGELGMAEPILGRLLMPAGIDAAGEAPGATDTGFAGGVIRIGDTVTASH